MKSFVLSIVAVFIIGIAVDSADACRRRRCQQHHRHVVKTVKKTVSAIRPLRRVKRVVTRTRTVCRGGVCTPE